VARGVVGQGLQGLLLVRARAAPARIVDRAGEHLLGPLLQVDRDRLGHDLILSQADTFVGASATMVGPRGRRGCEKVAAMSSPTESEVARGVGRRGRGP